MSKKYKNIQHTEAIRRKVKSQKEMSEIGLDIKDDMKTIGFVFNHLAISQITYLGISSINEVCRKYVGIDISLFSQHILKPCIDPLCPVFNISDILRWRGNPLITTSTATTIEALNSNASVIYHYVFDIDFIGKTNIKFSDILLSFNDPRIKIIVRHESYKKLIETEFDVKVCDLIIPDCNADKLLKYILTEEKCNG